MMLLKVLSGGGIVMFYALDAIQRIEIDWFIDI